MASAKKAAGAGGATGAGSKGSAKPFRQPSNTAGLAVIAKVDGFRRAGMVWSTKPSVVRLVDLTQEQEDMLRECPGLSVKDVFVEEPANEDVPPAGKEGAGAAGASEDGSQGAQDGEGDGAGQDEGGQQDGNEQ